MRKQQLRMARGGEVACDKNAGDADVRIGKIIGVDGATTQPVSTAKNTGTCDESLTFCGPFSQCCWQSAGESTSR